MTAKKCVQIRSPHDGGSMFTITCLEEAFTENELEEGALLFAREMMSLRKQKEYDPENDDEQMIISGSYKGTIEKWDWNGSCQISLDELHGELVKTSCGCSTYQQNRYVCPHITATLIQYLEKRDGRESLEHSCIEQLLRKKTGLEHPLLPGILRETDSDLSNLLKNTSSTSMSFSEPEKIPKNKIKVECYSLVERDFFRIELKAGPKRTYVIKSIRDFLNRYICSDTYTFGKEEIRLKPENFDDHGRMIMDMLSSVVETASGPFGRLFCGYGSQESREMILSGKNLDLFMEQVAVNGFFQGEDQLFFVPEDLKPSIQITKKVCGAVLKLKDASIFAKSSNWIYFKYKDLRISRVSIKRNATLEQLLLLLDQKKDLFVSEQDLPAVCREFMPLLQTETALTLKGLLLEAYLPEKPVFEFYLDYPQAGFITCKTYACYKETRYLLFDNNNYQDNRNYASENAIKQLLSQLFHAFDSNTCEMCLECDESALYQFLTEGISTLDTYGTVLISDRLKKLKVMPVTHFSVGISIESGLLDIKLTSEQLSRDELAEILSTYSPKKRFHRLKNGTFITFSEEQRTSLGALSDSFQHYGKKSQDHLQLPLFRALFIDEMLKNQDTIRLNKSREYRRLLKNMNSIGDNDYDVPDSLKDILRPYQVDGFYWMKALKDNAFGGILADDMGLGKTLQVISFLLSEKEAGKTGDDMRTLIITPASLIYNWQKEFQQFAPVLSVQIIAGTAQFRKDLITEGHDTDVWITSYDLLKRDVENYEQIIFANEIIDEAQFIKNQTTLASKSVRMVNSRFRMARTGTPIENRLSELWSIFDYLMPGFLYSYAKFKAEIESPVINDHDQDCMENMRRLVHPFILRRLKKDVLKDLPEKLEETVSVMLDGEQRKLYDAYEQRLKLYLDKQSADDFKNNKLEVLAELTKLRQICCGPELLLEQYSGGNAKLDVCMELVQQAISGGHKLLIFSQFTSALDEIGKRLQTDHIAFYRIDGSVNKEDRMEMVDSFQQDDVPVFCISLKAGGTGLNLTAADIVIHYDPWWNLAAQNQATDRVHRIGQQNTVNVYQLIAENTIEERIQKLQQSKYQLAEDVLSGDGIKSIFINKEDLLSLLS
jgi:SNF2 family DNA or RNA helicase